jgi:hypothetical protein
MNNVTQPTLTTDTIVLNAGDALPTSVDDYGSLLVVGQELYRQDTGGRYYWTGSAWAAVTDAQKLCQIVDLLKEILTVISSED